MGNPFQLALREAVAMQGTKAALAGAAVAALLAAGCGSSKVVTSATSSTSLSARATPSTQSPAPGSSRAGPTQAAVGDTVDLAGQQSGDHMAVTVTKVVDPAYGADSYESASPGNHLVAVQFRLQNTGTNDYSDAPSNGAVLVDSQGQQFNATIARTSAGPAFASPLVIPRGESALGFIAFELPNGSQVAKVQFTLASGFADQTGQWRVTDVSGGSPAATATVATATVTVPAGTTAAAGPQKVVEDYYAAINAHDYQRAWALGGKNLNSGYQAFVSGFAGTSWDTVTVTGVRGNTVTMDLDALQTDGSHKYFSGSYTVVNGVITSASVH